MAVNLARSLVRKGFKVGLLDIDVHGPSVPVMLGLEGRRLGESPNGIAPVETAGLKVVSVGFMLPDDDSPVIWRGPLKMGLIEQFLRDVEWGDLDFLIVDAPPGTGDEPLSVAQFLPEAYALIVTTPQRVSTMDVRKSITFCGKLNLEVFGLVQNMNGMVCPHCGEHIPVFPMGEAEKMAKDMGVSILASLPIDPAVSAAADHGQPFAESETSPTSMAMAPLVESLVSFAEMKRKAADAKELTQIAAAAPKKAEGKLVAAVPLADGKLTAHFGHCETFAFVTLDESSKTVVARRDLAPPPHEPGVIPRWVAEHGANLILAGGMGSKARDIFEAAGVNVVTGCPEDEPEALILAYVNGTLATGENVCDH